MKIFKVLLIMFLFVVICGCGSKITVDFIGVNGEIIKSIELKKGEELVYPDAPYVEGYQFIDWDKSYQTVEESTTINAIYEINKYVVKFYHNNQIIDTQIVEHGKSAVVPNDPKAPTGFYFAGWDQDYTNITSDITINSVFKDLEFTVKFYDKDNNLISEQTILYGKSASAPELDSVDDYVFVGWDTNFGLVKKDLEVRPIYELLTYKVQFIDKYGEIIKEEVVRPGEDAVAPENVDLAYHQFTGWDKDFTNVNEDLKITALYNEEKENLKMENVEYWLQILSDKYNINKTLLSLEDILKYNKNVVSSYSKTKVVDVLGLGETITGSQVTSLINSYSNINKYNVYNHTNNATVSSSDKDVILQNRNLSNIPTSINIQYGIITDFARMRTYPTNNYSSSYSKDMFQETSLNVGEGVAIYHTSSDGDWFFVQAKNYYGWVEKKNIGKCSYEDMVSMLSPEEKVVILEKYLTIENVKVRMGQYFPYINESDNSYAIIFPTRDNSGNLVKKNITISKSYKLSKGFLDYTYTNIYKQAFELLGVDYSWGDKEFDGWDCSSTQNAIYSCFGFILPRNTGNQKSIPGYGFSHSGVTDSLMKQRYLPGTLIFSSGHVMMYIGEDLNGVSYLFHNTSAGSAKCILQSLSGYGGSRIIGALKLQ